MGAGKRALLGFLAGLGGGLQDYTKQLTERQARQRELADRLAYQAQLYDTVKKRQMEDAYNQRIDQAKSAALANMYGRNNLDPYTGAVLPEVQQAIEEKAKRDIATYGAKSELGALNHAGIDPSTGEMRPEIMGAWKTKRDIQMGGSPDGGQDQSYLDMLYEKSKKTAEGRAAGTPKKKKKDDDDLEGLFD